MEHSPIPSEIKPKDERFYKLKYHKHLPKPPFNMVVCGAPSSGKTSFAYTLFNKWFKRYFDEFICFVATKDSRHVWEDIKQRGVFVGDYDAEKLSNYIKGLEETQQQRREEGKPLLRVGIFIDDYASDNLTAQGGKGNILNYISLNFRHLNVSVLFATQKIKQCLSPTYRNGVGYYVVFKLPKGDFMAVCDEVTDMNSKEFLDMFYPHISQSNQYLYVNKHKPLSDRFSLRIDRPIKIDVDDVEEIAFQKKK